MNFIMESDINEQKEFAYPCINVKRKERFFRKFTPRRVDGIVRNASRNIADYLSRYNREVEIEFKKRKCFNEEYVFAARITTKDGIVKGFIANTLLQNGKIDNFYSYYSAISTTIDFKSNREEDKIEYDGLSRIIRKSY